MKKTCLNCDTELNGELLEGFEVHTCPNCNRKYAFGIENYGALMRFYNEKRQHQSLTN